MEQTEEEPTFILLQSKNDVIDSTDGRGVSINLDNIQEEDDSAKNFQPNSIYNSSPEQVKS